MMTSRRKTEKLGEKPARYSLSTIYPTWTDLGANPDLRGERPATNHLSHGMTLVLYNREYSYLIP
jgi:hypothetical protein